jgi:beta-glucosidase
VAAGKADNIVARGQTVPVTGSGTTLGFLGTGDYGTASGSVTVTYTDGTTDTQSLSFADWYDAGPAAGGSIVATAAYHNTPTGTVTHDVHVYYASVPLVVGKTPAYVTLPDVSGPPMTNQIAMHVFAIGVG